MTREDLDFIGSMNMCDEISNEAYKKIVCHFEGQEPMVFKSSIMMDIEKAEKCHQKIKEQIKEGVVLLPYYIDLISPQEPKTEQEPKTGHWIKRDGYWECSECHAERAYGNEYCPDCGSHNGDIAKPYKESEGKE